MGWPKSLMLIDDDEDDRYIFLSVLENLQASVICSIATNGQEALDKLIDSNTVPELIFLDLNMPLMDGRQFLCEIKKHVTLKDIPVVILSTSSDRTIVNETKQLGAKDFITKPDRYSEWESALRKYLQRAV